MGSATVEGFELEGERSELRQILSDSWRSRDLIVMLSRKDFFVRYRRASFGLLWAVGLPAFQAAVLAVVFSRLIRFETSVPYGVFVFAAITPWSFFSSSINAAATSIVDGQNLATKVYFPRMILPLVVIGANFFAFIPALVVLVVFVILSGVGIGIHLLLLIPATLVLLALTAGFALVLSALHVYFRDVRYVVAAALLAWMYGTPVIYPLDRMHGVLRHVIEANPATGMVEFFRAAVGADDPGWTAALPWTFGWIVGLFVLGAILHRRFDRVFVDLL
ncbi:MAG: lipopolysaccharide transport system permease protein [Acidimicrobiaceae bacterium]